MKQRWLQLRLLPKEGEHSSGQQAGVLIHPCCLHRARAGELEPGHGSILFWGRRAVLWPCGEGTRWGLLMAGSLEPCWLRTWSDASECFPHLLLSQSSLTRLLS